MRYDAIQDYHPLQQFPGWLQWQQFHRYLLLSVAVMFWLFGVAWASLTPLYGLLYGSTIALGYGIFRLGMGRWMAVLCSILLMTSPVHLQQLPQLRDYSKAPFFFLIILVLGWLLKRPRPLGQSLPLAAVAGFFGGLGLGFRQDVSIAAGAFCLFIVLFSPGSPRATWWRRAAVVMVFVAAFAVLGAPIIKVLARVNNSTHDTIIGFMHYCDQRLGVQAPLYDFGDPFKDEYVRAMLMGYAYRTEGRTEVFRHYSPDYDAAGKAYFRAMALTFPGDLITRGYAAVLRTIDELQVSAHNAAPRGVTNQFLARLFQWRRDALDALPGGGRYHVAAMLLILAAVNVRLGIATFFGILLFAGYPALRFSERHAFHMEIIALFATGFLVYGLLAGACRAWQERRTLAPRPVLAAAGRGALRAGAFAVVAAVLLAVPLIAARAWQSHQVEPLLSAYDTADRALLVPEITSLDPETTFVRIPGLVEEGRGGRAPVQLPMYTEVLVLAFGPGETPVDVDFTYEADEPNFQFDRRMTVPAAPGVGVTHLYYPVYFGDEARFQGFSLPASARERIQACYRLTDLTKARILLNAVLPPNWRDLPRYQIFIR
jgi:hypothetical protein